MALLLLLLVQTLAVAPGDEDAECAVPRYPANIRVLLDSWRYQTLLDHSGAMWTTSTIGHDNTNAVNFVKTTMIFCIMIYIPMYYTVVFY